MICPLHRGQRGDLHVEWTAALDTCFEETWHELQQRIANEARTELDKVFRSGSVDILCWLRDPILTGEVSAFDARPDGTYPSGVTWGSGTFHVVLQYTWTIDEREYIVMFTARNITWYGSMGFINWRSWSNTRKVVDALNEARHKNTTEPVHVVD